MGLFWDSEEEKAEKRKLEEAKLKEEKAKKKAEIDRFLKLSDNEKFTFIYNELKRLDEVNRKQDDDIDSASTRATIGLFT